MTEQTNVDSVDTFGAWSTHDLGRADRFRITEWRGGRWLVAPSGHPLVVVGLCHSAINPKRRQPGDAIEGKFNNDPARYADDLLRWMKNTGFNTFSYGVPAGAKEAMNRIEDLNLIPGFIREPQFVDPFDPQWRRHIARLIAERVPLHREDPRVIGYSLSVPLLFSPGMERPRIWRFGQVKRQNYLMFIQSLPASAPGKQAYVAHLRRTYASFADFVHKRGAAAGATSFDELLTKDLSAIQDYAELPPDDAPFLTQMWSDLTRFIVTEIRKHDPATLIFSYRFIRIMRWPDPWLEAMLRGVGPHVDAFLPEIYADNAYEEIVDSIGRITGKSSLIADGMRYQEFVYAEEADAKLEALVYERMFARLLASPWFLGGCLCEYNGGLPDFEFYSPRPKEPRIGVRTPDFTERIPLYNCFQRLHLRKHQLRVDLLSAN